MRGSPDRAHTEMLAKLDAEVEKKRKAGYPLNNIIFEDTQTAILYQHGQRILIHGYDVIDLDIVWSILSTDVPKLIAELEQLTAA